MNLEALAAFLAVVDTGTLLGASEQLKVSRATIRRRLEELEAEVGVDLLHRTRQGTTPTQAGGVLARKGRLIVHQTSTLADIVREVGEEPSGLLRVAVQVGMPPQLAAPLFALMRFKYPRLRLHVSMLSDPMSALYDGADVAIFPAIEPPEGPWLIESVSDSVRDNLLASKSYLERFGVPTSPADLTNHTLLSWETPGEDPTHWPTLDGMLLPITPALTSDDIHMLRHCVSAGLGICLLPNPPIPEHPLMPDTLVPVLEDVVGRTRSFFIVYPKTLDGLSRVEALRRELMAVLPSLFDGQS